MAAKYRSAFSLVFERVSCIHCHLPFSVKGFARHTAQTCPTLQAEIDYIDSRIGA